MKVLHVESGRYLYGGARQVLYILEGLKARGVDNLLACPPGSDIAKAAGAAAQVFEVPMAGDADVGLVLRLRRLIQRERPHLVHLHSRRGADLFGTASAQPAAILSEKALWVMQIALILIGHVYGVIVAHRSARALYENKHAARRSLLPMLLFVVALSLAALYLMHMDMNMRVGRM